MSARWPARRIALVAVVAVVIAVMITMAVTGAITPSGVRDWLDSLGPAAPILFVGAFVLGLLVGLPGMAFVVGARLAFGPWWGFVLAYGGGVLAVTVPFLTTRALRRADVPPWRPAGRRVGKLFAQLERHPFGVVLALRSIFWFNAALTYALALSSVRARHYVGASAVALAPVVAIATLVSGWFT